MKDVFNGFKEFIMRGNVVELAVAVIIGAAFGQIVTAITDAIITPLIALIFRAPDLSGALSFTIVNTHFYPGVVLDAIINFLIIAAAVYFVIVLPINKLSSMRKKGETAEPEAPPEDVLLLQEIRDLIAQSTGGTTANFRGNPPAGSSD